MNYDIKKDFKDILKNILSSAYGLSKADLTDNYDSLVITFSKYMRQCLFLNRKWDVKISPQIVVPAARQNGFNKLIEALKNGNDILRYTTTLTDNINHNDTMLDCDGFYHFHLSDNPHPKKLNFNERTYERAFVYCDKSSSTAYIVDIYKHGAEQNNIKDRLLKLWTQFPEACKYIVQEGKLINSYDDSAISELRKNQVNCGIQLDNTHFFMPGIYGLTTARTSVIDTMYLIQTNKELDILDKLVQTILSKMKGENITDINIYNKGYSIYLKMLSDDMVKLDVLIVDSICP